MVRQVLDPRVRKLRYLNFQPGLEPKAAVERFLAMNPTADEVKSGMDYTALQAEYARKIKADTKVINAIVYGRLKLIARWAKLNPATPREETGRGKKKSSTEAKSFCPQTESCYRKVGDHEDKIDEYQEHQTEKKPDDEMSVAGFIRFATGTEKAGTAAHVSENTGIPEDLKTSCQLATFGQTARNWDRISGSCVTVTHAGVVKCL